MANDKILNIEIITPQKIVFAGEANSISLPGSLSPFQVLPSHAPIASALDAGIVKVVGGKETDYFAIGSGFAEVKNNQVSVLVETAMASSEINREKALAEIEALQDSIAKTKEESVKLMLLAKLQFAEFCLKVSERSKH